MSACEVCWTSEAIYECGLCHRRVCRAHYVIDRGICAICFENLCTVCNQRLAVDSCLICGKLVCRQCSKELQPGLRVCSKCYAHIHDYITRDARLSYIKRYLKSGKLSSA
ncbi:MAG: hypothetical protein QW130_02475 [Sulfolobales archaeon]